MPSIWKNAVPACTTSPFMSMNLDAELARLEGRGYRVVIGPKPGADGKRIAFLHPGDTAKVLVELNVNDAGKA